MITEEQMLLYAVTDQRWVGTQTLEEQIEEALKGGVTCLQLREKGLSEAEFIEEAIQIKKLTDAYGIPLIINDNVEVALASDASGVHVGQKDLDAYQVRKKLGPEKIIGVSARTVEQALAAEEMGADYLGCGAVFGTSTKKDALPIPKETISAICLAVQIPVVAIGGVTKENIPHLSGYGVNGVAVVSGLFGEEDIQMTARELAAVTRKMLEGR